MRCIKEHMIDLLLINLQSAFVHQPKLVYKHFYIFDTNAGRIHNLILQDALIYPYFNNDNSSPFIAHVYAVGHSRIARVAAIISPIRDYNVASTTFHPPIITPGAETQCSL